MSLRTTKYYLPTCFCLSACLSAYSSFVQALQTLEALHACIASHRIDLLVLYSIRVCVSWIRDQLTDPQRLSVVLQRYTTCCCCCYASAHTLCVVCVADYTRYYTRDDVPYALLAQARFYFGKVVLLLCTSCSAPDVRHHGASRTASHAETSRKCRGIPCAYVTRNP